MAMKGERRVGGALFLNERKADLFLAVVSTLMITFPVILVPLFNLVKELRWINTYWALIIPNIFNAYGIF
jgi:ABC-type glycerol-3-phosphate transport system permease component